MTDKQSDIAAFLFEFKEIVSSGRGLDLIPRWENNRTMIDLGLTKKNVVAVILGLSVADYCDGPQPNHDRPGNVWIFGIEIAGEAIYIKLKIAQVGETRVAKCISFHRAAFPLSHPLR